MRNALFVVTLGFLSAAAACDGSNRGSGSAGELPGSDGGPSESGGALPGTGGGPPGTGGRADTGGAPGTGGMAGTGGASGAGGAGRGGASGTGGAAGGGSGAGGAAIASSYGNCRNGLACTSGQTCVFDCQGNSGSAATNGSPAIRCACMNGALACTLMYEGTGGSMPPTCAGVIVFGQCSSACRICADTSSGAGCFCDMRGSWICTS